MSLARSAGFFALHGLDLAVIIAVAAVRMMQMSRDEIIDVVAVRHRLMSATGAMLVCRVMAAASMARGAGGRIGSIYVETMFLDPRLPDVVQMAVVQIVHMAAMLHGGVPAVGAMLMSVIFMMMGHVSLLV